MRDASPCERDVMYLASAPLRSDPQGSAAEFFRPAASLAGRPAPQRRWHVFGMIPSRQVTILSGDGGTGKSLLALQLAVATAAGRTWLGRDVEGGSAALLSAEDDVDELHRRFADIVAHHGLGLGDLGRLHLRSLAGQDAALATAERRTGGLAPTDLYDLVGRDLERIRPRLLVLDTLADLHSGDELNRVHARQFVQLVRHWAIRHGAAVLLLAHPSVSGMQSGSGASGSTGWGNSVRSRLYLERITDGGYEADPDRRVLTTKKANYAAAGAEIRMTWRDGVFAADDPPTRLELQSASAKARRVFAKLLRQLTAEGRDLNPSAGPNFAPSVMASHPGAEGCTKQALTRAMSDALGDGTAVIVEHGPPSKRHKRLRPGVGQ